MMSGDSPSHHMFGLSGKTMLWECARQIAGHCGDPPKQVAMPYAHACQLISWFYFGDPTRGEEVFDASPTGELWHVGTLLWWVDLQLNHYSLGPRAAGWNDDYPYSGYDGTSVQPKHG